MNKKKPTISIVIPTYNHANFLQRALTSIVSQKYLDWEVIIVDNHSDDHTDEIVNSFCNSKFKLLKIHNQGVIGVSRNRGIDCAQGEWIAFMDSDDLWYPSRLSSCSRFFESNSENFDVISTNEMMVFSDSNRRRILCHGPASDHMYRDMLLYGNRLSPSATLVRREFLNQNNLRFSVSKDFITVEDYDFWMCLAREDASFLFLNSVEGEYSIHGGNASYQLDKHAAATECVLRRHVFELQSFEDNKTKLWRKVKSRIYIFDGIKRLKAFNILKASYLIFLSILLSPFGLILVFRKIINIRN